MVFPRTIYDDKDLVVEFYRNEADDEFKKLKQGESVGIITAFEKKKFSKYDGLGFVYDSQDYYYIPGLMRQWDEGFLCPVYFSKDVLLYYNNHSDYRVVFTSFSRMHILDKNDKRIIYHGFGINRKGKIICWLGDLYEIFSLSENKIHKNQFLNFNVESDHDIVSDYYFNQIEANFIDSDNELKIFELRNEFDAKIITKYGVNLTHINLDLFQSDYKHPILNKTDQINSSYIKLNSLIIESLDVENLKNILIKTNVSDKEIKGLKGLKLFEKFLLHVLKISDSSTVVAPLYVLYDLRLLAGHIKDSEFNAKIESCKSRLNIPSSTSEIDLFESLVKSLITMYNDIISKIN